MRVNDYVLCICVGICCYACGHASAVMARPAVAAVSDRHAIQAAELHLAERLERVEQLQGRMARRLGVTP
jgi:hypothetical protein